jgi:hypothetical protein
MVATTAPAVVAPDPVVASVVASVVAQSNATTNQDATTDRPGLVWRIEINRRRKADGSYSYHWLYRFGSGSDRRAVYGGTIDELMALNPARWQSYLSNSEE